jgi:formylglycine-generating enzyme required for sulfatase activity
LVAAVVDHVAGVGAFVLAFVAMSAMGAPAAAQAPSASHPPGSVFREGANFPEMVVVPAQEFIMGSLPAETRREEISDDIANCERPRHWVSVPSFAIGKYDVTFAEWDACVADGGCNGYRPNDWGWGRGSHPVINVSWLDAQAYVAWLNRKVRALTGTSTAEDGPYRLPSEAEWEYAARAGTTSARWWGDAIGTGNANCFQCGRPWDGGKGTAPVGSFPANSFGLYEMLGNVWQWTGDCWSLNYDLSPRNGTANATGDCDWRVVRGGSWFSVPRYVRAAYRERYQTDWREYYVGFRVARSLP